MSSSPKFWQKLGLRKQNKSLSSSTTNSDNASIRSSASLYTIHDAPSETNGKQMKRFSNLRLRSRASFTSLRQQPIMDNAVRPAFVKPAIRKPAADSEESVESNMMSDLEDDHHPNMTHNKKSSIPSLVSSDYNLKKYTTPQPTRKQSCADLPNNNSAISKLPSPRVMKKTKSNQSLKSVSSASSRPGSADQKTKSKSVQSGTPIIKRKSIPKLDQKQSQTISSDEDDTKSNLTRSSSYSSIIDKRSKKKLSHDKKKNQSTEAGDNFVLDMLRDELEKEKAASRALLGQKEAIAKDLDYFCKLVDEVTDEKDEFKQKYEEEKTQNELLRKSLRNMQSSCNSIAKLNTEPLQQPSQENEETHTLFRQLQSKDDEITSLRNDLKQTQSQLQILRKTMEQMLRTDGRELEDASFSQESDDVKSLLLQASYHPNTETPPSPTPCYVISDTTEDDDDLMSTTSRDSYHSNKNHCFRPQYDFLKYDNLTEQIAKKKSEDYSKKIALSRRRKNQIEEMLGEVDMQLNRVRQKIRTPSS
ncbi:hypothetical protein EDC96DRAFT_520832 [Choanephora cucurbitarum]|nr:hypothetical protein EDC96DRAFT_520832 [Choanephora cucurbitarum]